MCSKKQRLYEPQEEVVEGDRRFDGTGSFHFPYGDPVGRVNWDMTKTDGLIKTVHGQCGDADALFEILDKLKEPYTQPSVPLIPSSPR